MDIYSTTTLLMAFGIAFQEKHIKTILMALKTKASFTTKTLNH
jgi:hypothetical protein